MKLFILALIASVLSACNIAESKKNSNLPPLASVAGLIKPSMNITDVNKALSGHKPDRKFSRPDGTVFEYNERVTDLKNNSINANSLAIRFDGDMKVKESLSSLCFLPDQEPPLSSSPSTRCYQKRIFPFGKEGTYDAIKRMLIISNYQIDHSDDASGIISATGMHKVEGDDEKMMFIKLSIMFTSYKSDTTDVVMSATFSTSEKQSTWVQAGFAGVTLPVPLPFQKKEEWIETGIVTPRFYLAFYDALSQLLASEEFFYYKEVATAKIADTPKLAVPSKQNDKTKIISNQKNGASTTPISMTTNQSIVDEALLNLTGPIDAVNNTKKQQPHKNSHIQTPKNYTSDQVKNNESFGFSKLNGKPIDSE